MKSAWYAAFALPLLCTSLSHPQASPANDAFSEGKGAPPASVASKEPGITEAELRQRLVGRPLFLRGLWLDETLHFNMNGDLVGQSAKGSFTLCGIMVDHVRMTKKDVVLEGVRFGVHFEGEAPWEDQATSFDRIQITPKKKHQVIVVDRQLVVIPKKKKGEKAGPNGTPVVAGASTASPSSSPASAADTGESATVASDGAAAAVATTAAPTGSGTAHSEPLAPTTISPAESAEHLRNALNKIFAPELDAKMVAQMPDYWQYFYQAQQSHKWLEPTDQTLVHPGPGVDGPRLVKNIVPDSNDYAQRSDVAGVASYKVIIDPKGKILAVAIYRPIGFGLDENAVAAIEKSTFAPAVKDGKPVSSVIDVAVNFRIYSKRTATGAAESAAAMETTAGASPVTGKPSMPGLYSAQTPKQ